MLPAEVARDADTVSVLGEPDHGDEEAAEPEDLFEFPLKVTCATS
jgi:hypothetical protein